MHGDGTERIVDAAQALARAGSFLFFRCGARFANPLVARELAVLSAQPGFDDPAVVETIERELVGRLPSLPVGIYSPVPIARALAQGRSAAEALADFRYEMIEIDPDQAWRWQGRPVAPRLRAFFLEHCAWEPDLDRHFFEYRVNDGWFDKCYFRGMTPLLASAAMVDERGRVAVRLNHGASDLLDLKTLRLDERERLLCRTCSNGEVLLSETDRLRLLQGVSDDLRTIRLAGREWRLRWPER